MKLVISDVLFTYLKELTNHRRNKYWCAASQTYTQMTFHQSWTIPTEILIDNYPPAQTHPYNFTQICLQLEISLISQTYSDMDLFTRK